MKDKKEVFYRFFKMNFLGLFILLTLFSFKSTSHTKHRSYRDNSEKYEIQNTYSHLKDSTNKLTELQEFITLMNLEWNEKFFDNCKRDWKTNWFLDGEKARVVNTPEGMEFFAESLAGADSSHAVLWTNTSFNGNLKIEYEFTSLDTARRYVNIIYILAEGSGLGKYDRDISKWSEMRAVPAMKTYLNNMNTFHISYAAYENSNTDSAADYIRARRYMPEAGSGLKGTELEPDYLETGLFEKNVPHKITVIKYKNELFMFIENPEKQFLCHWTNENFPDLLAGRVGLRQMGSRNSRYSNFRVSESR